MHDATSFVFSETTVIHCGNSRRELKQWRGICAAHISESLSVVFTAHSTAAIFRLFHPRQCKRPISENKWQIAVTLAADDTLADTRRLGAMR